MYKKIKELKDNTDTDFVFMDQRKCHEPDSVATTIEVLARMVPSVFQKSESNNKKKKRKEITEEEKMIPDDILMDWIRRMFYVQRDGTLELRQMYTPELVDYYKMMNDQERKDLKRGIEEEALRVAQHIRSNTVKRYNHCDGETIIKASDIELRVRGMVHCEISKRIQYREIEKYILQKMFDTYKEQHSLKPREQILLEVRLNGIFRNTALSGIIGKKSSHEVSLGQTVAPGLGRKWRKKADKVIENKNITPDLDEQLMDFTQKNISLPTDILNEARNTIEELEPPEEDGHEIIAKALMKNNKQQTKSAPVLSTIMRARTAAASLRSPNSNHNFANEKRINTRLSMTGLRRTSLVGITQKRDKIQEIEDEPLEFPEYKPACERKTLEEWQNSTSDLLKEYHELHKDEPKRMKPIRKKLYQLKSQRSRRSLSTRKSVFNKIQKEQVVIESEQDESKTLQMILESVWDMMETPNQHKIDFVYKYSIPENALHFKEVVYQWYKAAKAIVMREKLLDIRRRISQNRLLLDYQIIEECDCDYLQSVHCYDDGIDDDDTSVVFKAIQNIITKITNYCIACLDPLNDDITYRGHAYKKILSVVSTVDNELHSETTYSKNPFIKPVRVSQIDYYSKLDNETNSKLKELCDRILNEQANL